MSKRFVPRADSSPGAGSSPSNPPTAHSNTVLFIVLGVSGFTLLLLIGLIGAAVVRRRRKRQMLLDKNAPYGGMGMVKPNWWHAVNESGMHNMTVNTNDTKVHANVLNPPESAATDGGGEFVEIDQRMSIAPVPGTGPTNPQDAMLMPDISPCGPSPNSDRPVNSNLDLFDEEELMEEEEEEEVPLSPAPPAAATTPATKKASASWNRKSMALRGGDLSDRMVVSESIQSANAHYPFGEVAAGWQAKQMSPSTDVGGWDELVGRPRTPPPTM